MPSLAAVALLSNSASVKCAERRRFVIIIMEYMVSVIVLAGGEDLGEATPAVTDVSPLGMEGGSGKHRQDRQ